MSQPNPFSQGDECRGHKNKKDSYKKNMTRAERKRRRRLEAGDVVVQVVEEERLDIDSAVCIMTRASGGGNGEGTAWGGWVATAGT